MCKASDVKLNWRRLFIVSFARGQTVPGLHYKNKAKTVNRNGAACGANRRIYSDEALCLTSQ